MQLLQDEVEPEGLPFDIKIKKGIKMKLIMDACAKHKQIDSLSLRFVWRGLTVDGDSTALSLGLKDGDVVEALLLIDWDFLPGDDTGDYPSRIRSV